MTPYQKAVIKEIRKLDKKLAEEYWFIGIEFDTASKYKEELNTIIHEFKHRLGEVEDKIEKECKDMK